VLVRQQRLAVSETGPWHIDVCDRVTVVLSGEALAIEYRDGGAADHITVTPGQADWDEPALRPHRAVNIGTTPCERSRSSLSMHLEKIRSRGSPEHRKG
jgi:hypothetical protein